jgi:hypothetical protein
MSNFGMDWRHMPRCRVAGMTIVLGAAFAATAGAQQRTSATTTCPPGTVATSSTLPSTASAAVGAQSTPTSAGSTAGVAAPVPAVAPTAATTKDTAVAAVAANGAVVPNNSSTNPDQRFRDLNKTNGANGTGTMPPTTGSSSPTSPDTMAVASATAITRCVPSTGSAEPSNSNASGSAGGDVNLNATTPRDSTTAKDH